MADQRVAVIRGFDRGVSEAQDRANSNIDAAVPQWVKGGVLLTGIALGIGSTRITHKLKRSPQGWFLMRPRPATGAVAAAFAYPMESASDADFLTLVSAVALITDLWVW